MPVEQRTITLDTKTVTDTQTVSGVATPIDLGDCTVQLKKDTVTCSFDNQQTQINDLLADGYTLKLDEECRKVFEKADIPLPENIANDDSATVNQGESVTFNVIANDVSGTSQPLSIESFTQPSYGTVVQVSSTSFKYTHNGSDNLLDTFTYIATNDAGNTNTATVTITILEVTPAAYWVAGGQLNGSNQNLAISQDAVTWDYRTVPNSEVVFNISYFENQWYIVGGNLTADFQNPDRESKLYRTTDFENYEDITPSGFQEILNISYDGNTFYIYGRSTTNTIKSTQDFVNFTNHGLDEFDIACYHIEFAQNKIVATGEPDFSPDGSIVSGTNIDNLGNPDSNLGFGYDAKFSGAEWIATGFKISGTPISRSLDGYNWIAIDTDLIEVGRRLHRFNNLWLIGGRGNSNIISSTNGINWTQRLSNVQSVVRDFADRDGKILAVGRNDDNNTSQVYQSTDGTTWSPLSNIDMNLFSIETSPE